MKWTIEPARRLCGEIVVPGDKSISHRAVLLAALADGDTSLTGLADGEDVASSATAMRALGISVEQTTDGVQIEGKGLDGLRRPTRPIDCGNSGTTMRLLAGILAGQEFATTLTGDRSLRHRPMERIASPLRTMGAVVRTSDGAKPPLHITGARPLRAVRYHPEVASAQVKSCVLLAGLFADGETTVAETTATRDHTERMLFAQGARVSVSPGSVSVDSGPRLRRLGGRVPGDVSSAAYWIVAATLLEGSRLVLPGVGLNPTRIAVVDLLNSWGADIQVESWDDWYGEPVGTVRVVGVGHALTGGSVDGDSIPGLIDELPLVASLAPATRDGVEIRGAAELRFKESDRVASTAAALRALGVAVDEFPDGLAIAGGQRLAAGTVDAAGDHRIALSMAAVGLCAAGPVTIENAEAMAVSYPGFAAALERVVDR